MKKRLSLFILFFTILISCTKKNKIPNNSEVVAKYIVFEDSISRKIIKDLEIVKSFDKKNDDFKQPFKLNGKIYQFETEFKLNKGRLIRLEVHEYNSFKYSSYGLKKIEINKETIGFETLIKFSKSREQIIDSGDTLEIENVYPEEKLIFIKRNDGRINIYEYN